MSYWSTIGYVVTVLIVFVLAAAIMKSALDIDGDQAFGFTLGVLVIVTIGDIIRKGVERKGKASRNEQVQMQADINALKESVDEMKEYLTDLYIQQHDQKLSKKVDEP